MKKLYLVLGISLVLASGAWAQNLITNGTFDVPDINFGDEDPAVHWADTGWTHWGNVFRERWAAHSGHAGGFFKGWWSGDGGLYQDIPCTGGQHTFTAWVRREPAFHSLSNLEIKLEWIDSTGTNWVDTTVYGYYNTFPDDALWHQIHVTATGTDPNIVFIRPVIYCNWGTAGGSLAFDDMEIYPGPYTGAPPRLQNRSFEFYTTNGLRGTQWAGYPEWYEDWGPGNEAPWEMNTNWAARSGQNGVAFKGWLSYTNQFHMKLYQNFNPGTGTFTFAVWMRRESGFLMTNAGIRLDWYDGTFTNIISDGVSSNFIVPGDNTNWYEYFVTGTCTSDAIQEARVQVFAEWTNNPGGGSKALRIDDARFFAGTYEKGPGAELGPLLSHVYFNHPNRGTPDTESVPGLGDTQFLEYSYDPNVPGYYYVLAPQEGISHMRVRMSFSSAGDLWRDGVLYTSVVIDSAAPFHGYPAAGVVTMDVWRADFHTVGNWSNTMWYSPAVRTAVDGVDWWCAEDVDGVFSGDVWTNDWPSDPQRFWTQVPYDHDWEYNPTGTVPRYVTLDWAYYNNTNNNDPRTEIIPTVPGSVPFMQIDYANTATIWHVIAEKPIRELLPGEYSQILMRTIWQDPTDLAWKDSWPNLTWVSNLVLEAPGAMFHGLPLAGKHTVDLWRLVWTQPLNTNVVPAVPYTNAITVYYAPLLKVGFGGHVVDERYLVDHIEGATNGWGSNNYVTDPQFYGPIPWDDHDWYYVNQWVSNEDTDFDGIPDAWEMDRFGDLITSGVGSNSDGDVWLDIEEYWADTDPLDDLSFFENVITQQVGYGVMVLQAGPPTTNTRRYDVWWKTNLVSSEPWVPFNFNVFGRGDGQPVDLTVTNDGDYRFYQTGVKLEP